MRVRTVSLHNTTMTSKPKPLPLSETLRDLALLRSCDVDLANLLPPSADTTSTTEASEAELTVARSFEFVAQARAALKIMNREQVEKQGSRVEDIRSTLEDVNQGLGGDQH